MDHRQDFGRKNEKRAERFLRAQKHRAVTKNYRTAEGELDLITLSPEGMLVFTEVRSRRSDTAVHPAETVNARKQAHLRRAAMQFLYAHPEHQARVCRFDVITIVGEGRAATLEYFPDAF